MKIKKIIAILSAVTLTFSSVVDGFSAFVLRDYIIHAKAEEVSQSIIFPQLADIGLVNASYEEFEKTDDGWEYYIEDDDIIICGYSGMSQELIVPDEINGQMVIAIANEAFTDNQHIKSIELGRVQRIGYSAFKNCINLTEITIPKTVTQTGEYWNGCLEGSSIETVKFEEGIEKIPAYACKNASSVKNIILPEKEDVIDGYVIEDSAFLGTSISSITIPESVTDI
ncbi:MAG: leucine-rich repeat domain-containing protein, partial [Oscillospiraceae bacterium]|nr:leucine-rich repeat domain-containing protein [Oscillospiraceae bacterium]